MPSGTSDSTSLRSTYTPAFTRLEKTSSGLGFSLNSSMRPSSSVRAMPNSQGFSTGVRAMVTAAPVYRCVRISPATSSEANTSPLAARNTSSRRSSTSFIAPPVPRGSSS